MAGFSVHPIGNLAPDGLTDLARAADAEGIWIVDRVIDNWRAGTERSDHPGITHILARPRI